MTHPWLAHTKSKPKPRTKPLEKEIQKAIQQAMKLVHRIELKHMDAGGQSVKGIVALYPEWLREALGLPKCLPYGLTVWIHVPPAFPDLLGRLKDGRWVFVECKKPGGRFRPGQREFLELARKNGDIAFMADSVESALTLFSNQVAA